MHPVTGETDLSSLNLTGEVSIAAFEKNLFTTLQSNCGACHGAGQQPTFAVNDSLKSVETLIQFSLINSENPSASRIVEKVRQGHQGLNPALAGQLGSEIAIWLEEAANAEPSLPPPPAQPPQDPPPPGPPPPVGPPPPPTIVASFSSIHSLILVPKCVGCHNPSGIRPSEDYTSYVTTIITGKIVPGNAFASKAYTDCLNGFMPIGLSLLSIEELSAFQQWIDAGALNN